MGGLNMTWLRLLVLAVLTASAAMLAGCATPAGDMFKSKSEKNLEEGIKQYEDGKYPEALKNLQGALDIGLLKSEQVEAHKYMAFIYCVSNREKQCRDEFQIVLQINPDFELKPAEAGHPLWGPVFKSVKAGK
jgi:Tfp pilus assembly protein PilF